MQIKITKNWSNCKKPTIDTMLQIINRLPTVTADINDRIKILGHCAQAITLIIMRLSYSNKVTQNFNASRILFTGHNYTKGVQNISSDLILANVRHMVFFIKPMFLH